MKNIDVIINDKKLNGNAMCRACYMLKTGSNDGCSPFECRKCEFEDNEACYKFLAEEYKPKIKLTKFEYDLLMNCLEAAREDKEEKAKIKEWWVITGMKEKGYFKNVTDTSMKIKDILANCEIEEE